MEFDGAFWRSVTSSARFPFLKSMILSSDIQPPLSSHPLVEQRLMLESEDDCGSSEAPMLESAMAKVTSRPLFRSHHPMLITQISTKIKGANR